MMLLLFFGAKGGKILDKHRRNFAEGVKFSVHAAGKYYYLHQIMMLLLLFSVKTRKRLDKHRGNFAEGAKFLFFQCMRQAFLTSMMLFMMLLFYNIKIISPKAKKIWGYFAEGENF